MKKIKWISLNLLFIFSGFLNGTNLIDFEKGAQDFVLETKQIHIPGFPGAFNAAIIRWDGKLLLSFRVRDNDMVSTFEIGFVWLDDDFNLISEPKILKIFEKIPSPFFQNQDPRLIVVNQRLYMVYNNFVKFENMHMAIRQMFFAELYYNDDSFFIKDPCLLNPPQDSAYLASLHDGRHWEKNWVPFNYNETLLLARNLIPHHIVQPVENCECVTKSLTFPYIDWAWGALRGGTPAILDGNEYISFFHSSKVIATAHSNGKKIQHYFMGAYTFSAQPPFEIKRISPEPIVGKDFYHGPDYPTWKPLRVIFPMGILADENYFWVTYGKQDFEIWVAKIDKKGLYRSLIPCSEISNEAFKLFYRAYKKQIELDNANEDYEDCCCLENCYGIS